MQFTGKIPEEMRRDGCFCYWRYEERNGKRTKVPYNPRTGEPARSNDRATFCAFEELKNDSRYHGVGIGIFDGICAIDLDDCFDENGCPTELATDVMNIMHSYVEGSPGGKGIHIFFRANGFVYDTEKYYIMNHRLGLEIYVAGATSKYVTMVGAGSDTVMDFGDRSEELRQVLDKYMRRKEKEPVSENHGLNGINGMNLPEADPAVLTDEEIISRISSTGLWKGDFSGYPSHSEADMALCSRLAFWTGRDFQQMDRLFRRSGLMRDKWDRGQSGSTYGAITINKAITMCGETYHKQKPAPVTPMKQTDSLFAPLIPLEQESVTLSAFPVDALPTGIAEYVKAIAINTQTSADMAATIAVGEMASCLQGKYVIEPKPGYREPLNMFTMIIASPGERKSSVLNEMTAPLYAYEKEMNEKMAEAIRENANEREALEMKKEGIVMKLKRREDEELSRKLQDVNDRLHALPVLLPPRYIADDCTCESLTSLMAANNGCLTVVSTEGGIFDILTGRYSDKVNIDPWLKGHSGDPIRVDRLGRTTEFVAHPALSAILTVQPSVLNNIMENSTLDGRGLLARFMYCTPPSRIGCRAFITPPVPESVKAAYEDLIHHQCELSRMIRRTLAEMPVSSPLLRLEEEIIIRRSSNGRMIVQLPSPSII